MNTEDWTPEELETAALLGVKEIDKRITEVSDYNRYDTLAYYSVYDTPMNPAQMSAWAAFAKTLGNDVSITRDLAIVRPKSRDALALIVVRKEISDHK
jgi:hypothetical protein